MSDLQLRSALRRAGDSHDLSDIEIGVAEGRYQRWDGDDSTFITELLVTPGYKSLHFFLAAGNLRELEAMLPGILAWARAQGCTRASLIGRFGWQRTFVQKFGFKPYATMMEASLV